MIVERFAATEVTAITRHAVADLEAASGGEDETAAAVTMMMLKGLSRPNRSASY